MDIVQSRLRSPSDVLAAVPYLLGYKPDDSIVVLGLRRKKIVFQVRTDLPPVEAAHSVALQIADIVARQNVTGAVVVGYGPHDRVWSTVDPLCPELLRSGIAVLEALRADEGLYWSYVCGSEDCCSSLGTRYDVTATEIAAAATFAGMRPAESRAELVARLAPPTALARVAAEQAAARAEARLFDLIATAGASTGGTAMNGPGDDPFAAAISRGAVHGTTTGDGTITDVGAIPPADGFVPDGGERLRSLGADRAGSSVIRRAGRDAVEAAIAAGPGQCDDDLAWLALLLTDIPVRDHAWARVRGDLAAHVDLWSDVVCRVDPALAAAPATLLAYAAWRHGEGTIVSIALERAFEADPAYSMAHLLADAIAGGLAPGSWLDEGLSPERDARGHGRASRRAVPRATPRRTTTRRSPN